MSSSLRYTLTKLRSLPSSLYRLRRRSLCCVVRSASASPTVAPFTCTVSCFPVYCRRGVGIKILGINQLFLFRLGLLRIGQPAIGVVELTFLNRQHDK